MSTTLPPPVIPPNLPADAHWLAGEGAGSWFVVTLLPQNQDMLSVQRYDPHGHVECRGLFIREQLSSVFDPRKPHVITFPSHCARITLLQDGQVFTLIPVPSELIPI